MYFESATAGIDAFEQFAAALQGQREALAGSVLKRLRAKARSEGQPTDLPWDRIEPLIRESLRAQLASFGHGHLPECCPQVDAAAVEALSRSSELELLLGGYRTAQITLWEAWFGLIEESSSALSDSQRRELLARGSDFFFRYADLLSDYVAEAYRREVELVRGNGEQRRFRAIKELLDGDPLAGSWLGIELDRYHLGLIAWGADPASAARRLAAELSRPIFSVSPLESVPSCWAWISATRPLEPAEQRLIERFQPSGTRIALGLEAFGETGFRATHRQAQRARRFANEDGPPLLRYEDVVIEALASENEDDARAFVEHELRGIEDDSETSRRLRETLQAYFASEYNAASAAATLGVHQQTVANRLRAAEERLGHCSIGVRRVELETALRLRSRLTSRPAA